MAQELTKKPTTQRWRNMKQTPKGKKVSLFLRGDDGKTYDGYFEQGQLFSRAPGWVTYTGWRKGTPKEKTPEKE